MKNAIKVRIERLERIMDEAKGLLSEIKTLEEDNSAIDISVRDFALSCVNTHVRQRFYRACLCAGIKTVAELVAMPVECFQKTRNVGRITIRSVQKALRENYGVEWR